MAGARRYQSYDGFRTSFEIEQERQALKALRGDYAEISEQR
jgi:hypothetical protein